MLVDSDSGSSQRVGHHYSSVSVSRMHTKKKIVVTIGESSVTWDLALALDLRLGLDPPESFGSVRLRLEFEFVSRSQRDNKNKTTKILGAAGATVTQVEV